MSKESLEFHIESDDYFGTLATILDLVKQLAFEEGHNKNKKVIEDKIAELLYMQDNYYIVKKSKSRL